MVNGSHIQNSGSGGRSHQDRWSRDADTICLARTGRPERRIRLVAEPQPIVADLNASAFVIIDMQNDFLSPQGWFAVERNVDVAPLHAPIPVINTLSSAFRRLGVPVLHVNWGVRADAANLPANVLDKASACGEHAGYGDMCGPGRVLVAGDWGAQTAPEIETGSDDILVHKHRFSGFRDNELDHILRRLGVHHLFFAGVNIDRCVFATLMDAAFEGYDPILLEDACATVSPQFVSDATLYLVRLLYGFSAVSTDLMAELEAAASDDLHQRRV